MVLFDPYNLIRIWVVIPDPNSGSSPTFDTDLDPGKWQGFYGSGSATLLAMVLSLMKVFNEISQARDEILYYHDTSILENSKWTVTNLQYK